MKKIALFLSIVIVIALAGAFTVKYYNKTTHSNDIYLIIKEGESLSQISKNLKNKNIIKSSKYFELYAKLMGYDTSIKSGKYIIGKGITLKGILEKLKGGKSDFEVVTIPEGYSFFQIASRLESYGLVDKSEFLNLVLGDVDEEKLITINKEPHYELEGYLFPDTYYIPKNLDEKEIAQLMFDRFEYVFKKEYRERAKELNLSISEVITIASLIEKEAANDEERKAISGVIYNRIKKGMPLQIDASVIYAIKKGEGNIKSVSSKDLKFESDYNTYINKGLPRGPIASPGKPSIEAALYPEEHDYLYYVLNPAEDKHVFSKTYEEHRSNIKKYLK